MLMFNLSKLMQTNFLLLEAEALLKAIYGDST